MGTAFIIMQIGDPELDQVCAKAIVPALKACGLEPKRVDKHNKGGLLKSEIIDFIKSSDIILADLTNERPNCYLEIGYTMGINKFRNLILTVREDHLPERPAFVQGGPKVHFDLAGYDILSWRKDKLDIFQQELEKRIRRRLAILETKEEKQSQVWDEEWLAKNREAALTGLAKAQLPGKREMYFALYPPKGAWSQQELDDAARSSMINRSGWPVGVYFPNGEFRPKPRADGIVAEIATEDGASYDYWAIKTNGDFYSLSSLWEDHDHAAPPKLFYEATIRKATEGLLYCARLNSRLGVDPTSRIKFLYHYAGLKGRILTGEDIVGAFVLRKRQCSEDEMTAEIDTSLKDIKTNIINLVKELLSPIFVLFDFYTLPDSEYKNLVKRFARSEIS